ncbi:AAA family ATPase [Paraglaciecola arctica]|uniref:ORC1/DEAH AAA+ ATPase domain-containing protein n=1 Tax=Paraglaciecola arctica BSs20135 TaxID=493475 RepID=K6ZA69_9ALTE|nr:AAA family ATPase [Paraglaciecola arctica]GAC20310.1 hypothetical protein GARC_3352 [Paraglaciecola arctica BSs20135]
MTEANLLLEQWIDDNPFITSLQMLKLTESELISRLSARDDITPNYSALPNSTKRIGLAKRFYVPPEYAFDLYNQIHHMILIGYLNRHPKTDDYDKYLNLVENGEVSVKNLPAPNALLDAGTAMLCMGRSGHGKTTVHDKMLETLNPFGNFHPPSENTGFRRLPQVMFVKTYIKSATSKKAFLVSILNAIDKKLNSHLTAKLPSRDTVGEQVDYVIKICRMVGLGLLVIDDIQWVLNSKTTKDNKVVTNVFLEEFYNDLGVPMIFIGTPEAGDLFSAPEQSEQSERRLISDGKFVLSDHFIEHLTWKTMVKALSMNFLGLSEKLVDKEFEHAIFYYCEGNISKLKRLVNHILIANLSMTKSNRFNSLYTAHAATHIRKESIKPKIPTVDVTPAYSAEKTAQIDDKNTQKKDSKNQERIDRIKRLQALDMGDE